MLAVLRAGDLDEAFAHRQRHRLRADRRHLSRSPGASRRAQRELLVGNLYLNRGITGALVGRQPFGGFKMSGIGSKAGGPEYLLQFVVPRTDHREHHAPRLRATDGRRRLTQYRQRSGKCKAAARASR